MKFTGERIIPEDKNSSPQTLIYKEQMERYFMTSEYIKGKKVLDVACGVGNGTAFLAQKANYVFGIDCDKQSINYATDNYKSENIEFLIEDAQTLNFKDDFFDVVVSFETIEHLPEPERFLGQVKRVLKSEGIFILSSPDRKITEEILIDTSYKNPFHIKEFTLGELNSLLHNFFEVKEIYGQFVYNPSKIKIVTRNVARLFYGLDRGKALKKILPLSWIL